MFRYLLGFSLIIIAASPLRAQDEPLSKGQAKSLFIRYEYAKSLAIYLQLAQKKNPKADVVEGVADCYRLLNNYVEAEQWYARLVTMPGARPIDTYYYAETLLRNLKLDKAKTEYNLYFAKNGTKAQLDFKLATCDSAAIWMKTPTAYKITAEPEMNTANGEWGVNYAGKTSLVFTSDRKVEDFSIKKPKDKHTGDWLKMFNYDEINQFTEELQFDKNDDINLSIDYHTGPMVINATGDTAYITVTTRESKSKIPTDRNTGNEHIYTRRLEILRAIKHGDKWGSLTRFPYNNVRYSIGHAALSKNGQLIYFTSDMPGGLGGTDIWYCEKMANGLWSKPVNCGSNINTPADEAFPAIGGDDRLYYSSRGLPGMGGLDIFWARGARANWSKPINLKYPVNTTSDDFCFVTRDGLNGYLSSNREGGKGNDDIYSFSINKETAKQPEPNNVTLAKPTIIPPPVVTVPGPAVTPVPQAQATLTRPPIMAPPVAVTTPAPASVTVAPPAAKQQPASSITVATPVGTQVLEGTITNSETGQGIDSVTVLLKNSRGDIVFGNLVPVNRSFSFKINNGQDYTLEARKKGYYPATQKISANAAPLINTSFKLQMEPLEIGKTFVLRNIYYDLNRATIRKDAMVELDKLVALMKENPSLKIELSSHTDSRGSDYYNMLLSQARAISAVAYIKRRGITADRMVAKGYGETRLLNGCINGVPCSEDDHQQNRRTEIKVIGGDFGK